MEFIMILNMFIPIQFEAITPQVTQITVGWEDKSCVRLMGTTFMAKDLDTSVSLIQKACEPTFKGE